MRIFSLVTTLTLLLHSGAALAQDLPLPRFATVKSNEANVRTGPGKRYQIKWVIVKENMPVEIVREFEQWRKIRDIMGDEGWVHMNMLSGVRHVILQPSTELLRKTNSVSSRAVAKLEQGVIAELQNCDVEWCKISASDEVEGWVPRKSLWGIYPGEVIE